MTLYAIYTPRSSRVGLPLAIGDGFSAFAALLPPVYLLRHGLWLETLIWLAHGIALVYLARLVGEGAVFWLYAVGATWLGFAAASLRRAAAERGGWRLRGYRVALSTELAQLGSLR